ncbi:MAG: FAD-binding protein, partial [Eubacteriales bacterium]
VGKNLTEWQFGLASLHPRWNVSGTYMQALPRFVSRNADGTDEKEFLTDYFPNKGDLYTNVFLKGYEWPFNARKSRQSSLIDILVYMETVVRGRQVFLDFLKNPHGLDFSSLSPEAAAYIQNAGADFGTPVERLIHMNRPAYEFYLSKGVDLKTQALPIALCAQHNNGGLATDCWWQTNIEGFFAAGEVCGSHGIYRPGGSALNAGQVGSMRAAQAIAANRMQSPASREEFLQIANPAVQMCMELAQGALQAESNIGELWKNAAQRMSCAGGPVRELQIIRKAVEEAVADLKSLHTVAKIQSVVETKKLFALRDMLIAQVVYLSAMADYAEKGGKSRGSAIYIQPGSHLAELSSFFTFETEQPDDHSLIQEVRYAEGKCIFTRRAPRELPPEDDCFENVWKTYLQNQNIY